MKHNYTFSHMSTKFGIYAIMGPNNKVYIGSTARNFYDRLCAHMSTLRKNKHSSILLQRAWNKYGEYAFEFKIIEVLQDKKTCIPREIINIELYKANEPLFGYNVSKVVNNRLGHIQSEETKNKISKSLKGTKKPKGFAERLNKSRCGTNNPMYGKTEPIESKVKRTAVHKKKVIRSDGTIFASINEAAKAIKVSSQSVSQSLRKGYKCKGFIFNYL